jgi:hypothetical protein
LVIENQNPKPQPPGFSSKKNNGTRKSVIVFSTYSSWKTTEARRSGPKTFLTTKYTMEHKGESKTTPKSQRRGDRGEQRTEET